MKYQFEFIDTLGKTWRLASGEDGPMLAGDATPGPVAKPEETRQRAGSGVGESVSGIVFPQMVGTIDVGICVDWMADKAGVTVDRVRAEFVAAWERTRPSRPGTLVVTRDDGERFVCSARLGPGGVSYPPREPGVGRIERVSIDVVSDDGLWFVPRMDKRRNVTVTNSGHGLVWVEIVWNLAGGTVICPSGAKFTLPAVDAPRRLYLNENESCLVVVDATKARDVATTTRLRDAGVFPEAVPDDGKPYKFTIPADARLEWKIGVKSPWG